VLQENWRSKVLLPSAKARSTSLANAGGAWLKYKIKKSQEFVIGGYTMGGNPFAALIVGCYERGKLKYVGKVRAGFVPPMRCTMFPLLQKVLTEKCPFADLPEKRRTLYSLTKDEMHNCQWLKPLLVAQIEFRRAVAQNAFVSRIVGLCRANSESPVIRHNGSYIT
jgi:ATP-dependent DNA ligase